MIGRHHDEHGVLALRERAQRGDGQRGRGIARHRLQHEACAASVAMQLLGRGEAVFLIADDDGIRHARLVRRQAVEPVRGGLQQRLIADQADELLRKVFARHRPEPCARSSRENDGLNGEPCVATGTRGNFVE